MFYIQTFFINQLQFLINLKHFVYEPGGAEIDAAAKTKLQ